MKSTRISARWKKQLVPFAAALVLSGVRMAGAADYPTTILADSPIAYYRLEETSGTTAVDSSASGAYPGVYNINGSYPLLGQPGIDSNSIALSVAQPSSVTAGYYEALNQQAPFSFEIWAKPISTDPANYRCPVGNFSGWGTATQSGWYVYQIAGSPTAFACITASGVWIQSAPITLFNWYHIVGTYDGTNMSFYLNGTLVGTQSAAGYTANSVNNAGVNPIALGFRGDSSGYGAFDGNLDEFAYYTNVLTAAQVLAHYEAGTNSIRLPAAPTLLKDTASETNYAGTTAQFSVIASGAAPLTYQWYEGTAPINGATNSTLSFTCAPADDGTTYQVIVTNYVGSVTSSVATLTVLTNLQIDGPLTSIQRNAGSVAAFEIVAEGAGPITYQWHNGDGSTILGATNPVLWLSHVQLTNDGASYYVSVINPYTSIDSDPATLNVQARPANVPTNGYAKVVVADGPVAFWQLNESAASSTAVDTVGSFDGSYVAGTGNFTFGVPTGVPHDTNVGVGVIGGASISIPYAIEINPPGAFSVEGWFQPASLSTNASSDYRTPLSSMSNPYGAGPTGWLVYQTGGNNWAWWPYNGFWTGIQLTDTDPIVAGQWYYLVMTYDGTTFTFYVNGVAKAFATDSGFVQNGNVPSAGAASYNYNYNTTPGLPTGSSSAVLGWRSDSGFNPFIGNMDDVAVYNKALTPSQIQNHFLNTTHLTITSSGNNVVVSWPVGTLQVSTNVLGTYTNVTGATSPYTNSASSTLFYRALLQ